MAAEDSFEEHRHESLYMADGDIVISAGSFIEPQTIQLLRVHKNILAYHSAVFRDMLAMGENSENERYDGAPRVHLKGDAAEDLAGLIGALYNPATLPLERLSPDTPLKIHGIMTLAVKYQMDVVRTMIIRHIEADWPVTLADYERRNVEMQKLILSKQREDPTRSGYDYTLFPEPASAIRFAMEFDCPKILPGAFYELARGEEFLEWETTELNCFGSRPARWGLLRSGDLLRLLRGKQYLLRHWAVITRRLKESVTAGCAAVPQGQEDGAYHRATSCEKLIDTLFREDFAYPHNADPLGALLELDRYLVSPMLELLDRGYWCCEGGQDGLRHGMRQEAQKIWDSLPEVFNLKDLLAHDPVIR